MGAKVKTTLFRDGGGTATTSVGRGEDSRAASAKFHSISAGEYKKIYYTRVRVLHIIKCVYRVRTRLCEQSRSGKSDHALLKSKRLR